MTTSRNGRASFSSSSGALLALPHARTHGETQAFDLNSSSQDPTAYTTADPAYLSSQLKSSEWLHRYGLKSQKLTFDQILQQIGFKRVERSNASGGKTIGAGNHYQEIEQDNGDRYVLTCRPEKLREFRNRLVRMLNLLRKRMSFITSGSRRVFGILGEPSVCLVCDCKTSDQRIFNQFQLTITTLLKEQVSKIKRFNIIWVTNDYEIFQEQPIDATSTTIDQAIDWICARKYIRNKISISATCEAILKAFTNTVHSIYLISEGNSSDTAREMLRDNIVKTRLASTTPIPIHVVSLFCHNNDTEVFLRSIAQTTDGSYFSYKIQTEISNFKTPSNQSDPTRIKSQEKKLQFSSNALPSNFESPIDISLMHKEINQCQTIIDRLDKILGLMRDDNENSSSTIDSTTKSLDAFNMPNKSIQSESNLQRSLIIQSSALFNHDENDMASADWLKIYGVDAQKLDFYSVLQSAASQHCDGLVSSYKSSNESNGNTPAAAASAKGKRINTKYCDQFSHVTWSDGTIRHVYVTPEIHRDYERRMRALIEKIKARLSWLKRGSRDVFGTILEKNIYILIDTSRSMENHLNFVKQKLHLLIQDQLFSKERVNMASFNNIVNPWRDSLTKINTKTTSSQLQPWIDGLYTEGSTNTLAALRFALSDTGTEAIYLLTDGRPDQNERYILSQIEYRQVIPVHTIAFNCQDQTTNQFLFDLAKKTGGRFHAFNYGLDNSPSIEIPESEDITNLRQEIIRAEKDLQRVADLRDECMGRTWSEENLQRKYPTLQLTEQPLALKMLSQSTFDQTSQPNSPTTMPQRIDRKKRPSISLNRKQKSRSITQHFEQNDTININPAQWLLPETTNSKEKSLSDDESPQVDSNESIKNLPTPYDDVRVYLKKNSLVSKGLTIFDILKPTSVTVKDPEYIQVIDRYVLAKVWDDILPLTYGSYAKKFRLVNHYAVDLEKYEMKLRDLIRDYYRFTARFIWKCLDDDEKRKLGPKVYWISLSTEARNKYAQEITKEENTNREALEFFAWRKLTKEEQHNLLQKPAIYHEETAVVLRSGLKDAECVSGLQGVARMDVEINRAIKFLQISNDLRQYQKRSDTDPKQSIGENSINKRNTSSTIRRFGQRVLCRYDGDGYFYSGTIQKNPGNKSIVLFDMDIEQETIGHVLLPMNSNNLLNLFLQDCVLVRQLRDMEEYWVPGLVLCLPSPGVLPGNLYKIQIYDPRAKQIYAHRKDMVRISLGLFQRTVLYLQNINRKSTTDETLILDRYQKPFSPNDDFKSILRKMLDPLTEKVNYISKSHDERYSQLQIAMEDQMGAIRILQERPYKSQVKFEYTQTTEVSIIDPTSSEEEEQPASLSIEPGTHVYAVWSDDDGLVYEGIVIGSTGSNKYTVERKDYPGVESDISRNDIFLHSDRRRLETTDVPSFALIKYPRDSRHCFCPSVILRHLRDDAKSKVRFYDCYEEDLSNDQYVIPIQEEQFERYARIRIEKENALVNQVIVGLKDRTTTFMLGTIQDRVGTGHQYEIKWYDESINYQKEEHLFGAFTRRDQHRKNNYVLAMDQHDNIYKFAKTVAISNDEKQLTVQFLDSNDTERDSSDSLKIATVPAATTFVITKDYLDTIHSHPHT